MARVARVPVQTVIIETDSPYLSKGWPALRIPKHLPITVRVRLGRRFDVSTDQDVNAFVDGLHEYFCSELAGAELGTLWDADRQTSHDDKPAEAKLPPRVEVPAAIPPLTSSRWG
jgi:hypothetical protein